MSSLQRLLLLAACLWALMATAMAFVPHGQACQDAATMGLPFCNMTLPVATRVADLIARLTIDEKIGLAGNISSAVLCVSYPLPANTNAVPPSSHPFTKVLIQGATCALGWISAWTGWVSRRFLVLLNAPAPSRLPAILMSSMLPTAQPCFRRPCPSQHRLIAR